MSQQSTGQAVQVPKYPHTDTAANVFREREKRENQNDLKDVYSPSRVRTGLEWTRHPSLADTGITVLDAWMIEGSHDSSQQEKEAGERAESGL